MKALEQATEVRSEVPVRDLLLSDSWSSPPRSRPPPDRPRLVMSDSDASYDDYYASDNSAEAMSGSDIDEDLVLDEDTFGDVGGDESPALLEYRSFNAADVRQRQHDAVQRVTAVLQISPPEATALLRHHKWNVNHVNDSWFADEEGVRAKVGLLALETDEEMSTKKEEADGAMDEKETTCLVCFENFNGTPNTTCGCGHHFCGDCWGGYLESAVNDGPSCLDLRCPDTNCARRVPETMVTEFLSASGADSGSTQGTNPILEKYKTFQWRSWVDDNPKVTWCVAPGCERALVSERGANAGGTASNAADVTCACGASFCWQCKEQAHRPVPCDTVNKWLIKNSAESENLSWILANTKPCPKCKRPIEKSTGCMHMCCSQCKHDFCWMCLEEWNSHGERTGGYYACNKYERVKNTAGFSEEEKKRQAAKSSLERYTHYYERWAAHGDSEKKARADYVDWNRKKLNKLGDLQNTPVTQLSFILDALTQIAECRRVLKWTYGYGYYHFDADADPVKKEFFEFTQADAEVTLERLTAAVEMELETFLGEERTGGEFLDFRGKLNGLTSITSKYFNTLVVEMEAGFPGVAEEAEKYEEETGASGSNVNGTAAQTTPDEKITGPDGSRLIRRISRGIREAVIGGRKGVASRTRSHDEI